MSEEGEGFLGYDVGYVAWNYGLGTATAGRRGIDECGVVVEALAWEDRPTSVVISEIWPLYAGSMWP